MRILNSFLKNKKGSGMALVGIFWLLMSMYLVMLLLEIGRLYLVVDHFQNDLDFANGSVWAVVDRERLSNRLIQFHGLTESREDGDERAREKFIEYLQKNMDLNGSMKPADPNQTIIDGPVTVKKFETYISTDVPLTNGDGILVTKASVYSQINVPIKLMFPMFGTVDYNATITKMTDLESKL